MGRWCRRWRIQSLSYLKMWRYIFQTHHHSIIFCKRLYCMVKRFTKHKSKTCQQYYVVRYARLEAARISHKCYDKFHLVEECEAITQQVINKPAPTKLQLDEWYTENLRSLRELGADTSDTGNWFLCGAFFVFSTNFLYCTINIFGYHGIHSF